MTAAFYLLLVIGHLGFFDVVWFHGHRFRLQDRPECRREVFLHTMRHAVYAIQFLCIANLRFHGSALAVFAVVYAVDVAVAWADVWEEKSSRRLLGGLDRGEYLMHVVLSVGVGAYLACLLPAVWPDRLLPTAILIDPPAVPFVCRMWMSAMGISAAGFFGRDLTRWLSRREQAAPTA
jgi:hypothetical protein